MAYLNMNFSNFKEPFSAKDLTFISSHQFLALNRHFKRVLHTIQHDEDLQRIRLEFSKLLQLFQSLFQESERKTYKIRELIALNEVQKAKHVSPAENETIESLKGTIKNLQLNLDDANKQKTELMEDVKGLKKMVETQNQIIQVRPKSLDQQSQIDGSPQIYRSEVKNYIKFDLKKYHKKEDLNIGVEENSELKVTDAKVLRNNLTILVADLKLARQKIEDLKKELHVRDDIVKTYSMDASKAEIMLSKTENNFFQNIQKPLQESLAWYEKELNEKEENLRGVSKELEKGSLLNTKLTKLISSMELEMSKMKTKLEKMNSSKEIALRKANIFEKNLAKSQNHIEALNCETKTLKDKVENLEKQISTEASSPLTGFEREKKNIQETYEKTIDSLKSQVTLQDQKIREINAELSSTVKILQSVKEDIIAANKEKLCLESETVDLKKKLKDRNSDIKLLKEKLNEEIKELQDVKRDLQSRILKHQQVVDKRSKLHSMYTQMKFVNDQQRKENVILGKRQEYLVKMLKEKDIEIQKLVTWKRFII